jgi:TP901 family phage tail tape measure protein
MRTQGARQFQAEVAGDATAVRALGNESRTAGAKMAAAGRRMERMGRTMTRNVTTPVVFAGAAATKFAVEFDQNMRNVNAIAQLPEKGLQRLSKQVLALAGPTAQAPSTLAKGLNDLVQSGYSTQNALKLLEVASHSASAGLTTADVATSAIVSTLKSYRMGVGQASHVSDVLFKTVDIGRVTYADLAQQLGRVLQPAGALGVKIEELGAGFGVLTNRGYTAETASTGLNQMLVQLIKPSAQLDKQLHRLGVKSGPEAIKKFGSLQGVMQALYKSTGDNQLSFQGLFRGSQAGAAAFTMVGANAKDTNQALKQMNDSTGSTGKALDQVSKGPAYRWQKFMAEMKADAIKVGNIIVPQFVKLLHKAEKLVDTFKGLPAPLRKAIGYATVLVATLGPLAWIGGKFARGIGKVARLGRRGGPGGMIAKATGVVPVYVTNMGGMPGGGGVPGGGKGGLFKKVAPFLLRGGPAALGAGATAWAANEARKQFNREHKRTKGWTGLDRRREAAARAREVGPRSRRPALDAQGFPTGRYRAGPSSFVDANTRAARGHGLQIPNVIVQIDGKTVATAVHREAKKDRSRR